MGFSARQVEGTIWSGRIGELPPGMELEVSEARWVPLDDAPSVLSYRGEREMAERAMDALTGVSV